jgi:hypothetical protein
MEQKLEVDKYFSELSETGKVLVKETLLEQGISLDHLIMMRKEFLETKIKTQSKLNRTEPLNFASFGKLTSAPTPPTTFKAILSHVLSRLGSERLLDITQLQCFSNQPSFNSVLKTLRGENMQGARKIVEQVYLTMKRS